MFINLSNHPSSQWTKEQMKAALEYGEFVELPFPNIPPEFGPEEVAALSDEYFQKIEAMLEGIKQESVIHLTGEHTFVFALVLKLLRSDYRVITSTTYHDTMDLGDGKKLTNFFFIRFRDYKL